MTKDFKNMKTQLTNFRKLFTIILILNMLVLIERAIFDFLGFMFGMIIGDVLEAILIIVGLFGAFQFRVNYIVVCITGSLLWLGWNIFIICTYLNIGTLRRYDPIALNLNTGRKSWWLSSSIGCTMPVNASEISWTIQSMLSPKNMTIEQLQSSQSLDEFIDKHCFMSFYWIEIIHSSVMIFFCTITIIFGLLLANSFNDEDDAFDYIGGFDTTNIVNAFNNSDQMPSNAHIRLEPIYVTGINK